MALTTAQRTFLEGTTAQYTATLKDETGTVIPLTTLATLTLTLFNEADNSTINSRSGQDVLNDNNVTYHATSGLLTWEVQPADTPIVDTTLERDCTELHIARFEGTWPSGTPTKTVRHELKMLVKQLANTP